MMEKVLRVELSCEVIAEFCKTGNFTCCIVSEIPSDAVVKSVHYIESRNTFNVIFEHPSFYLVPEGASIKRVLPEIQIQKLECVHG